MASAGIEPTTAVGGVASDVRQRRSVPPTVRAGAGRRPTKPSRLPSLDEGPNNSARCDRVKVVNTETGEIVGMPCKSWHCPRCSVSNRRAFQKRLRLGLGSTLIGTEIPKLLTLTSMPSEWPWQSREQLTRRFAEVRRRLERAFPGCELEYAGAVELTRSGAIHFHVVLRGVPYMPQATWSRLVASCGFGPVVDIRRVRSGEVGAYLSKDLGGYLTKSANTHSWPPHFRRIRFSRDWAPEWLPRARSDRHGGDQSPWILHHIAVRSSDELPTRAIGWAVAGQGPPLAGGAAALPLMRGPVAHA
jgi:hypothetical protein